MTSVVVEEEVAVVVVAETGKCVSTFSEVSAEIARVRTCTSDPAAEELWGWTAWVCQPCLKKAAQEAAAVEEEVLPISRASQDLEQEGAAAAVEVFRCKEEEQATTQ
jgi:hypothetical protein